MLDGKRLSLGTLMRVFWRQIGVTWTLTFVETILLASLPLLLGRSIDGLIENSWQPFGVLIAGMAALLVFGIGRRVYDTRAYGTMRVEIGAATARAREGQSLSAIDARLDMSRELVDFLEVEAPLLLIALVHAVVAIAVLLAFHWALSVAAAGGALLSIAIYAVFGRRFFHLNSALNTQAEKQVSALEAGEPKTLREHLVLLRRHRVCLSDLEAIVYGLIFACLLAMLAFNLWFATTQTSATPGEVFSIVVYSYEFIESAVTLPVVLQSVTRLWEITARINAD